MRPTFVSGDMVLALIADVDGDVRYHPSIVVSVAQANSVPDAQNRGIDVHQWVYYVLAMASDQVVGPLFCDWLRHV